MREARQTNFVGFRASPALIAALIAKAGQAGCSTSELLRSIIREKVGLQ